LRENELLGDVLYWWEQKDPNLKFILKKKVYLDPRETPIDPVAEYLVFHQATYDFVNDAFPCTQREAIKLAALQLQILWGDFDQHQKKPASVKQIESEVTKYLPKGMLNNRPTSEWITNVMEKYSSFGKVKVVYTKTKDE
jgi:hypothetical protein